MKSLLTYLLNISLLFFLCLSTIAQAKPVKRFALVVGANDGGKERMNLRYANNDAQAFANVLGQLGGLDKTFLHVLTNASKTELDTGLDDLARTIQAENSSYRPEVIFYYSGHSNENGLLLGDSLYAYEKLKERVTKLPAEVKVMVIDSCASGSLTLAKGGTKKAAFLMDESIQTKGHAIITSSSSDEVAQESSRVKGSYFTHYFITGLRGAADANNDQRITLNEAYQYAYNETLNQTQKSQKGPQHPSYDIALAGKGELVLTDLRRSTSTLFFSESLVGRYYISTTKGDLVSEIRKIEEKPLSLGLEPGEYKIVRSQEGSYSEAVFELKENETLDVGSLTFKTFQGEPTIARGARGEKVNYTLKSMSFQFVPDIDDVKAHKNNEEHKFVFGLLGGHSGKISGASLSILGHIVESGGVNGCMMAGGLNFNQGTLSGAQIAAGGNYTSEEVSGAQLASGANIAAANLTGVQISNVNIGFKEVHGSQIGGVSYAKKLHGAQVGIVNIAEEVEGAQVGIVSYAEKISGFQLGIATVSQESSGYSLGLINYAGNGTLDTEVSFDELEFTNFAIKMGGKYLYTIYTAGWRGVNNADDQFIFGLGIGAKYRISSFQASLDLIQSNSPNSAINTTNDEEDNKTEKSESIARNRGFFKANLTISYLVNRFSIFGGPTFGHFSGNSAIFKKDIAPHYHWTTWSGENHTSWLGALLGVRYSFKQ